MKYSITFFLMFFLLALPEVGHVDAQTKHAPGSRGSGARKKQTVKKNKTSKKSAKKGKKIPEHVWNKTPMLMKYVKPIKNPLPGMDRECIARLRASRIRFDILSGVKGVKTPLKLYETKLGGVVYRRAWNNKTAPWILDCKTVENLIIVGKKLRAYGIASMYWTSAWRYSFVHGTNKLSNHAYGRAIDITAIDGGFGYAALIGGWERCGGCGQGCPTKKGRALRAAVCALKGSGIFKTVYTPDYDALHRDHFHIDSPNEAHKLKVKVKPEHYGKVEDKKEDQTPDDKKTDKKVDESDRNHWNDQEPELEYEPPRSRPHHY